jgi:hypothetical protein
MKVLAKGRQQKGWAKEYTCLMAIGGCGARLLVEEADIHMWGGHDYGDGYDEYASFRCGWCGVENNISVVDIPAAVRNRKMGRAL